MSSPATLSGFGSTLKDMRRRRGVTQLQVAEGVGVSRATLAQWETGRHLPSSERTRVLDTFLDAHGALSQLAERVRESGRSRGAGMVPPVAEVGDGTSLLEVFRRVEAALTANLERDADGQPLGWCHNLQHSGVKSPTPYATAFGIKAALLIEETSKVDLGSLGRRLREMALDDGGWAARSQRASRPEAIAIVVDALARVDPTADLDQPLGLLEKRFDEIARQRPSIMATVLETVLDLQPGSDFATNLISSLLASRQAHGEDGLMLWSQKAEPGLAAPEPSVAHTARAVSVLARAQSMGMASQELVDALGVAVAWLCEQTDLDNTSENVDREVEGRRESLYLRHFTSSWVVRALLLADVSASSPAVVDGLSQLWVYFYDEQALWRWGNGDLPVWMTFDAIAALRLAALATFLVPLKIPAR